MLSESARMSSAAEARFRIQAPNSKPRVIKVIALDARSEDVVRRLATGSWKHATFLTASASAGMPRTEQHSLVDGWLRDLAGSRTSLTNEVESADLVVMVAMPGGNAQAASIIGEACSLRRVTTTALVGGGASASEEAVSKTLAQVRPWSLMVVIANPDDFIDDMLIALRA
jgi:hypothetical protein